MKIKPPKEQLEIEKAITMLVNCVVKKCSNEKPLILHSIRVGFKLQEIKQPKEVIIAGFLHDLIEDTDCKISQIKKKFGPKVAKLVSACSLPYIKDDRVRWVRFLDQVTKAGKEAEIIKIVDAYDNLPYVSLIEDPKYLKRILWKHQVLIERFRPEVGNLEIFKEYHKKYKQIARKF